MLRIITCFIISLGTYTALWSQDISQERDSLVQEIRDLQQYLTKLDISTFDSLNAQKLVRFTSAFAEKYPQDSLSGAFLFMAADVSRGLGNFRTAIRYWKQFFDQYPEHELHPMSLFLRGFTWQVNLKEEEEAQQCFEQFVQQFPEHELVRDAKTFLKQISDRQ